MMKKGFFAVAVLGITLLLGACGAKAAGSTGDSGDTSSVWDGVTIDYGTSSLYTQEDMNTGIGLIKQEFSGWEGTEMHSIQYAGDDCNNQENIDWANDISDGKNYTQCMEFISSFHTPKEGGGAWEPDTEYEGYQWWLARSDGGDWVLYSWGY